MKATFSLVTCLLMHCLKNYKIIINNFFWSAVDLWGLQKSRLTDIAHTYSPQIEMCCETGFSKKYFFLNNNQTPKLFDKHTIKPLYTQHLDPSLNPVTNGAVRAQNKECSQLAIESYIVIL